MSKLRLSTRFFELTPLSLHTCTALFIGSPQSYRYGTFPYKECGLNVTKAPIGNSSSAIYSVVTCEKLSFYDRPPN
ncbi:hypothetical protein F5B19DRAFT_450921 [Rostrohypoxylon terebratum]|nr:hypothetical protein F5B19DRAFT_450921 [Rostrohypoxylon terebratum]